MKNLIEKKREGDILHYILTDDFFKHGFESIMKLIEIYAALPTTNSEIERGFSCMKRIKTALRNKLSVWRLQDLMIIALNGEDQMKVLIIGTQLMMSITWKKIDFIF